MRIDLRRSGTELAFVLGILGVAMLVGLHLLPSFGGIDPVHGMLSGYPLLGRFDVNVLYFLGLLMVNAAAVVLGATLARLGLLHGPSIGLLTAWCFSLLGLTVVPTHPPDTSDTWYGDVHAAYATINFVSLPLLGVLLWLRFRRAQRWRTYARTLGALAVVTAAAAIPFVMTFVANGGGQTTAGLGLLERGIIIVDVAVMITLMCWSKALAAASAQATVSAQATRTPATAARATGALATGAPATRARATDALATGARATAARATDALATASAQATRTPATGAPATRARATRARATDALATASAQATRTPATGALATGAPATAARATRARATRA